MSHHFDTKLAKEDPSLNLCDFYLFDGTPETTVMAMTVNPDLGLSSPDTLHIEGLYAFRFDLNADAREEVTFKFRFAEPRHADASEHTHIQSYQVRRATGDAALHGADGELLIEGETGKVASASGIRAWVGIAPELFAANANGLHAYLTAFFQDHRYNGDAFQNHQNFFSRRNVTAIVLEVPNHLIGQGKVHAWTTISLYGHAPEVQVSRWGLPLVTHIFLKESASPALPPYSDLKEEFNASTPSGDVSRFAPVIAAFAEKMTTYAGSAPNPAEYGKQLAARLCPTILPYEIGTPAVFDVARFNGRALTDDAMDVMLSLTANQPIVDGAVPDTTRIRADFPWYGEPYSKDEQVQVTPMHPPENSPAKK